MDPVNNASTRSYLDFQGLGELKGRAARDDKSALRETAQQFEAMFLQMMMKSMRESVEKSDLTQSEHADMFEGMFDREVSMAMARRNSLGVADMLVQAQTRQMSAMSTAEALQSRPGEPAGKAADKPTIRRLDASQPALPLQPSAPAWEALKRPGGPIPLNKVGGDR
jgi:Rod binding domain-containing protein